MTPKIGKQLRIDNHINYNMIYGTVNNIKPKSIYVSISSWAKPMINDEINYKTIITKLQKKIKKHLFDKLEPEFFDIKRSIVVFDMRESGIRFNKKSYMNCEITLYQKKLFKLGDDVLQSNLNKISDTLINDILNKSKHFEFFKTKKQLKAPEQKFWGFFIFNNIFIIVGLI